MNGGMAMSSYKDYKKRALQNPEVKAEYDALQPEYDIIQDIFYIVTVEFLDTFQLPFGNHLTGIARSIGAYFLLSQPDSLPV